MRMHMHMRTSVANPKKYLCLNPPASLDAREPIRYSNSPVGRVKLGTHTRN